MSTYKGKALGTIGHMGCFSFHETKNYQCGEGGCLILNDEKYIERAEIIREKGTNRSRFFRGQVDKYTWVDLGSSYLPSELNAAFLYAQLEAARIINDDRLQSWNRYYQNLQGCALELPYIPGNMTHNAHMFYIKLKDIEQRSNLIEYLKEKQIQAVFHYIPLHSTDAGKQFGCFHQEDLHTSLESERVLRLPLYYDLEPETIDRITSAVKSFLSSDQC